MDLCLHMQHTAGAEKAQGRDARLERVAWMKLAARVRSRGDGAEAPTGAWHRHGSELLTAWGKVGQKRISGKRSRGGR